MVFDQVHAKASDMNVNFIKQLGAVLIIAVCPVSANALDRDALYPDV